MNGFLQSQTFDAIDLFSGGGGLTLGLKRAGFTVKVAVENSSHARATYEANHPEVRLCGDIKLVTASEIIRTVRRVDLMAACPPCQGFCTLTRRTKPDPRNELINEVARLVEDLRPRCVMLENVPGLVMGKGKPLFESFVGRLRAAGYLVNYGVLQVADFGIPQRRRRLVLLAGKNFEVTLPTRTHDVAGRKGLRLWNSVRSALECMRHKEPVTTQEAKASGDPNHFNWHVVRTISAANRARLTAALPGKLRGCLPQELRPNCHKGHDEGFHNSYGRLQWDAPSVTITAGCTTPSKGRFGHPEAQRTISVREAALLQTFPPDYVFRTDSMERVCQIVGNALPCDFAEIVASQCFRALQRRN